MSEFASREVTPDMINGNQLTDECVMAAVFQAEVLMSVSLRVFEKEKYADPDSSSQTDCTTFPF